MPCLMPIRVKLLELQRNRHKVVKLKDLYLLERVTTYWKFYARGAAVVLNVIGQKLIDFL